MMERVADGTSEDTHTLSDRRGSIYNKFQVKPNFKTVPTALMKLKKKGKYKAYLNRCRRIKDVNGGLTPDGARALCQLPAGTKDADATRRIAFLPLVVKPTSKSRRTPSRCYL